MIDIDKFTRHLKTHAKDPEKKKGECAKWVRLALEDGGANIKGFPMSARDYGPLLIRNGFHQITIEDPETFLFMKGDIVVIDKIDKNDKGVAHPYGHIAGFDGVNWISDFVQRDFWPGPDYRKEKPSYVIYRP